MVPVERQRVLDEADRWFARLRAPDIKPEERARFEAWRRDNLAHARAYEEVGRLWQSLDALEPMPTARLPQPRVPRALAALLLAGLVGLVGLLIAGPGLLDDRYVTGPGEQKTVYLADGSTVHLNTRSRLRIDMSDDLRRVWLAEGEALFEVAHDPARPFLVQTGAVDVRVLGTRFNVQRIDDRVEIAVVGGRVAVEAEDEPQIAPLAAGDRVQVSQGKVERDQVAPRAIASWRSGRLIFHNEPLDRAVADLNRYLSEELILGDADLAKLRLTGVVRVEDRDSIVQALTTALPVRALRVGRNKLMLVRPDAM